MNKFLTLFSALLILNISTTLSTNASEEFYYSNLSECIATTNSISPKKERKISEFLHKCPIISKFFNRTVNIDYVAEDNMLTEYMLGTSNQYDNEIGILVTYYD